MCSLQTAGVGMYSLYVKGQKKELYIMPSVLNRYYVLRKLQVTGVSL